jgi:hypothetical protein
MAACFVCFHSLNGSAGVAGVSASRETGGRRCGSLRCHSMAEDPRPRKGMMQPSAEGKRVQPHSLSSRATVALTRLNGRQPITTAAVVAQRPQAGWAERATTPCGCMAELVTAAGRLGVVLSPVLGACPPAPYRYRSFGRVVSASLIAFAWGRGNSQRSGQRQGGHLVGA